MAYTVKSSERLRPSAADTESKALLYLMNFREDSEEIIFSLLNTERDPIFSMEIIPYYALFIQSCQEYMGETLIEENAKRIKDIRNLIKAYGEGFGKSTLLEEKFSIEKITLQHL